MSLRLRLIVSFFLLSVVPLAAVTLYTYTNNARAMRDAARHEAELLAGELTQRMQLVTAQLSERVGHLMDLQRQAEAATGEDPVLVAKVSRPVEPDTAAPPVAPAPAIAPEPDTQSASTETVAEALGEVAMLLNNIEVRGLRGFGDRRGGPPAAPGSADGRGGDPRGFRRGPGGPLPPAPPPIPGTPQPAPGGTLLPQPQPQAQSQSQRSSAATSSAGAATSSSSSAVGQQTTATPPALDRPGRDRARTFPGDRAANQPSGDGQRSRNLPFDASAFGARSSVPTVPGAASVPAPPTAPPAPGSPAVPPGAASDDPNRIMIDMMPIRREIMQQVIGSSEQWQKLSPEERQRLVGEVNQRMLGIVQGIHMGAAELQKKVIEAQRAADSKAREAAETAKAEAMRRHVAAKPPKPATAKVPATTTVVLKTPTRKMALSGSRLDITVERDGEVLRRANAEINLPNLLATVFTTTRRDKGEVPFAVAKDGRVYTQSDQDLSRVQALSAVVKPGVATGTTMLTDWVVVTTADPMGSGLILGIARPVGESLQDLRRRSARNAGLGFAFIGLALIGIAPLSSHLTRNLTTLSEGVRRIAQGDYSARVKVRSHDEIGRLAQAFNQMAEDVEQHQRAAVEQERIKRELELGRQIQHDMLPHAPLRLGLTEIKGVSVPAREVGGDFFNYFALTDGRIALLVGDVSGKGVGAALLMANIQASLRTRLALGQDLAAIAREIDVDIEGSTPGPVYATLFVGILNPVTRELRYVNAGHNPQYILRANRTLERMTSSGLPVGLLAGHGYTEAASQLAPGDVLFFYTDGCVEAENELGEMFGAERLEELLVSATGAEDPMARVQAVITEFRGKREPFDDATIMVVRVG